MGFGVVKLATGGIVPCCIASTTFTKPAMPAVSKEWPMLALTLPSGIFRLPRSSRGKTSAKADSSVASPTWVEVAWASIYCTSCGPMAPRYARFIAKACPDFIGAQRLLPRPSAEMPMSRIRA